MAGRLKQDGKQLRDSVEAALFQHQCDSKLDLVELRIRQALEKQLGVEDLLTPALDDLAHVRRDLTGARRILAELWKIGQEVRWEII